MAAIAFPLDASSGAPSYSGQMLRQTLSALAGTAPSGRPLGAVSGVRPGTPATTVFLSGGSNFTWNVAAHSGVIDGETSAAAGPYFYATDGTDTGTITAANATNPRIDIIYVQINDNTQDGSALENAVVGYLAGTPAGSPVAPAAPARSIVLANIAVPAVGGGNPAASWAAVNFGSASATAYTPTLSGITLGNGTMTGRYTYNPATKMVNATVVITAGSTTTYSGALVVGLPLSANATLPPGFPVGSAYGDNGSSATRQSAVPVLNSSNNVFVLASSANSVWNVTAPFAWGTSAHLYLSVAYEAA